MRTAILSLLPVAAFAAVVPAGYAVLAARDDPNVQVLKPEFTQPGSQRVKIRLGPYTLPAINDATAERMPMKDAYGGEGMEDEGGLLDKMVMSIQKPCDNCMLKYAKANLEYADGSTANLNTGAWLHHLALSVHSPTKEDLACGTKGSERLLAAHNDRAETVFGISGNDKMGYYLAKEDVISMALELKNEAEKPRTTYLTLTWEFVPGKPVGYQNVKTLWLDAAACGAPSSEIPAPPGDQFTLESKPWTAAQDGMHMLNTVGHMHDGGVHLEVFNNGKVVCDSKATYGGNPLYIGAKDVSPELAKYDHISELSFCHDMGELKKGDNLQLKAHYDLVQHPGLRNTKGKLSGVMGISVMFVALPE